MSSFFEKLIGNQAETPKTSEEKISTAKKPFKKLSKQKVALPEPEEKEPELSVKPEMKMAKEEKTKLPIEKKQVISGEDKRLPEKVEKKPWATKDWSGSEGKLAIDIFQTDQEIVLQSAIAGVKPEDLEVTIENGMIKVFGHREKSETTTKDNYLIQECHWGDFSRQFVLPSEVDAAHAQASLKDGILTIRVPRIQREKVTKLQIR
jgi:HSP20 family protein